MSTRQLSKPRLRRRVVGSMRSCVGRERLPIGLKWGYITACQQVLRALDVGSEDVPIVSECGTMVSGGPTGSTLGSVLEYRGVFEPVLSEFILRHVREGEICVDAGANVGYFTLLLAKCVGASGKVIAIEAAPGNARRLRQNLELNAVADRVEVVEAACAAEPGELTFYLHPGNDIWARLTPPAKGELARLFMGRSWEPVAVTAAPLSQLVGSDAERTSFLKVDIEGAEPMVTPDVVAHFTHPSLVVALEAVSPHMEDTLGPFRDAGFHLYDLKNNYRWVYESHVPAITAGSYDRFVRRKLADVLVSRRPLELS